MIPTLRPHWSEKLRPWPRRRPSGIVFSLDMPNQIVFVHGLGPVGPILGVPYRTWLEVAGEIHQTLAAPRPRRKTRD